MRSSKWFCIIPLVLLIALVCQPLWPAPPKGHDWLLHFYRIPVVSSLWQSGVLFSRWQPDLVLGYGSPLFLFYPPGSAYLLTALYWLTGQNAPLAYTLSFAVALALAAVGMFLLGRALYGGWGAWVAAIAYTLSPHLLYQTYERGSLSNALAMGLFPWALWGMVQLAKRPFPKWVVITAVSLCLIFLSHAAASLIFAPFLLLAAISYQLLAINNQPSTVSDPPSSLLAPRSPLLTPHSSLLLGLCLAAFSWLPGLAEFSATRYQASAQAVDFHDYFASPLLAWPSTMVAELHNAPLPKSAGAGLVLLTVGGVALTLWQSWHKKPDWFGLLLIGAGGGLLFLTTAASAWVWEHVTPLQNFQFPWRLLDIPVLCLALLAAKGLTAVSPKWQFPLTTAATLLLFANALPYLYPPRLHNLPTQLTPADASQAQQQWSIWGLTAWGEYSAATVPGWPSTTPFPQADQGATLGQKLQPINGATIITSTPWQTEIELNLPQATHLTFYTHYFPGWQAQVDGGRVEVEADENGRISIPVPAGEHTLFVYWGRTPVRWLADGLSLAALVVLIGVVWRRGKREERREKSEERGANERNLPPATYHLPLSLLLLLLFIGKVAWVDRFDTPLVIHAQNGRISTTTQPAWGNFNNHLQLTGYDLQPDGLLTLYWHAQQDSLPLYHVVINLVDARGIPAKTITNPLPGTTPTNFWEAGQLTRDVYELPIRLGQRPIGYQVSVALVDPQTNQAVPLVDASAGQVEVLLGRLKLPPPETAESTTAPLVHFGDGIQLQDVSLPAQVKVGETAEITLFWHVLAPLPADYTIFIHLLHPDGTLAAANDGPPVNGFYPTSYWGAGELIPDDHPWQAALPPGHYQVQIGLYRPDTGERLPTNNDLGDRIIIGQIEVTD